MHMLGVGRSREIHAKAAAMGFRLSVIAAKAKVASLDPGIYHRIVGVSPGAGAAEWVALARAIHAVDPIEAVGGLSETTQWAAALIARELGLPYASPEVVRYSRDKYAMREALRAAGLDDTPSRTVTDRAGVEAFAAEVGYPIVLKPRDGQGKIGFTKLTGRESIDAALARFTLQAPDSEMLVERFLDGDEYSVEAFSEGGVHRTICVTKKYKDPDTFIEIGHCVPAPLPDEETQRLRGFAVRVLDALGVVNGPSHTEIMVGPHGSRVVETHVRLPGGAVVDLISLLSGVDLDELWIRQLAGETVLPLVPASLDGHAASAFVVPKGPGVVRSVTGESEAAGMPGVVRVKLIFEPGTVVSDVYDSDSRGAGVLAVGSTGAEAVERSRAAVSRLTFAIAG
jgi:biotin carboxylase